MDDIGFIGSGSRFNPRFGSGDQVTAKQLNDVAVGTQTGLPMQYVGDGPSVSFTSGGTIITSLQTDSSIGYKPFDVVVSKVETEYRLQMVQGVCPAFVIRGFADESPDGAMTMIQNIYAPNIYPTDSRVIGTNPESIFLDNGGYLKLEPNNDYMLFLFLLQPAQVDTPQEFQAIQLVLSKIASGQPNSIIDNLQSKSFFSIDFTGQSFNLDYSQTWCIRDNIAQFVWDEEGKRFVVYQFTNSPKLFYPVFNAYDQISQGDTLTNPMIASFSGYTKDLETLGSLVTPAHQDKFPPLHS
jgi:hypothetical protein